MLPEGAIDLHVHAGPSYFDRKHDAIELAEVVADAGMGGVVIKSHLGNTHKAAGLADSRVEGVDVYSSSVLNSFVGGFNPTAVESALATDARVIWLPTFSAANFGPEVIGREFPFSNQNLTALDEEGDLKDEVRDVLATLADADRKVTLGNGHLGREESFAVLDAMEEMGLDVPYLVTHADFDFMGLTLEDQLAFADRGAVIEKCYLTHRMGDVTVEELVESIDAIGPEQCVLSTDHGQADNASPPEAYGEFVDVLLDAGVSETDIEQMAVDTPRRLLDPT